MKRSRGLNLLLCALIAGVAGCERGEHADGTKNASVKPPNVIFILVDTLRADRIGCYGNRRDNAPTIDALAREGVLFERAVAPSPWTQPSMASLFAGVYPTAHGVMGYQQAYESVVGEAPSVTVFADSFQTIAESMKHAGYTTAAFVANPFIVRAFGFAQGFDHFDDSFADNMTNGDVVNQAALDWLKARTDDKPLFLYLHYMDVHGPYAAPPKFLDPLLDELERTGVTELLSPEAVRKLDYLWKPPTGPTDLERNDRLSHYREYWSARYESGIRQVDHYLAQLRFELTERGLWDDAYIILTADHGEALYEHGLWDHGFSVYHTDLHVPLILRWPGRLPAGTRVDELVRLIDVYATLAEQLGLAVPKKTQGRSLDPLATGASGWNPDTAYAEGVKIGPEQRAIYAGGWKLLLRTDTNQVELYHVVRDQLEQNNVAEKHPKVVDQMRTMLDEQFEHNQECAQGIETRRAPITSEQIKRLRALGYVDD